MRQTACAVTGHRPSRFKFKYSEDYSLCKKIKRAMLEQFKRLYYEHGLRRYYVGGALGVDMWAGELILREAGGETRSLPDGGELKYNEEDLHNPWFVCRSKFCPAL